MAELKKGLKIRDRYELREYKGSGSFGEVWKAYDELVGAEVAIKVYISLDQRGVDEFRNEYRTTVGVQHENLLVPKHIDIWEHRPFLIMKYCEKGSATTLIEKADETVLWQFIHDVAAGLAYLHSLDEPMIHQDIKPDNILIGSHGRFLITDFGISRRLRSTMRKQSKRAAAAGATSYMGPERFEEDPMPVKASDIWSLGASIYEIATGELPFSGLGGVMQKNGASRPRLGEQWSCDLNMVMRSCLNINTWDRPKASDLEAFAAAKLRGENPTPTWKTDVPVPVPAPDPTPDPSPDSTSATNKRRMMMWVTIAAIGVVIGGLVTFLLTNNNPSDPTPIPSPVDTTVNTPVTPANTTDTTATAAVPQDNSATDQATVFANAKKAGNVSAIRKLAQQGYDPAQKYMGNLAEQQFKAGKYDTARSYAKAAGGYGKSVLAKINNQNKTAANEGNKKKEGADEKNASATPKRDDATMMRLAAQGDPEAQKYMAQRADAAFKSGNYQQAQTFAKAAGAKGKPVLEKLKKIHYN